MFLLSTNLLVAQRWSQISKTTARNPVPFAELGSSLAQDGNTLVAGSITDALSYNNTDFLKDAGSVTVYTISGNGDLVAGQKLSASNRSEGARFGSTVSVNGDFIAIGAPLEDSTAIGGDTGHRSGRAYIFKKQNSGSWEEHMILRAPELISNDLFGMSVSIGRNFLFVGATEHVYVFKLVNDQWIFHSELISSDHWPEDRFGMLVGISGDYAIVSAEGEDEDQNGVGTKSESGSCYIYKYSAAQDKWVQTQKIVASDRIFHGYFGTSISIRNDLVVVGARGSGLDKYSQNFLECAGAAYVYQLVNGKWEFTEKLVASDRHEYAFHGTSVSVNGDFIVVGAQYFWYNKQSNKDTSVNYGAAYVYERVNGNWLLSSKLTPGFRNTKFQFGRSVSMGENFCHVGGPLNNTDSMNQPSGFKSGGVYTFKMDESVTIEDIGHDKFNTTIYPVPASSHIYLSSDLLNSTTNGQIAFTYQIIDTKGVVKQVGTHDSNGIVISSLASGLYFLRLQSGSNQVTVRFVKSE